jgi:hypothetical protein
MQAGSTKAGMQGKLAGAIERDVCCMRPISALGGLSQAAATGGMVMGTSADCVMEVQQTQCDNQAGTHSNWHGLACCWAAIPETSSGSYDTYIHLRLQCCWTSMVHLPSVFVSDLVPVSP